MKRIAFVVMAALMLAACQESLEERCEREAREFTEKKCPSLITPGVTIDSMTFNKASQTMSYYYSLSGVLDNSEALNKNNLRDILLKELKNSTQTQMCKEAGYNFRYVYYSTQKKGTKLFEATFQEKDYR